MHNVSECRSVSNKCSRGRHSLDHVSSVLGTGLWDRLTGEIAGLEEAQEEAKRDENCPLLNEAKANLIC
jgi:hypothetical protein